MAEMTPEEQALIKAFAETETGRATPPDALQKYLDCPMIPKSEAEHYAARTIRELKARLKAADKKLADKDKRIEKLEIIEAAFETCYPQEYEKAERASQ